MKVTEYADWVKVMIHTPVKDRAKWVKIILEGIRSYRAQDPKKKADPETVWLSDLLQDRSKFELIGFCPNVQYIKHRGSPEHLESVWVHPWGTPQLLYKHKSLPLVMIAGPGIRLDESVLSESGGNPPENTVGLTG